MKGNILKAVAITGMALTLVVVLAVNVVCGIFSKTISVYLYGYGVNFEGTEQVMQQGDALCQEIEAEGIVLLKNDNNALPLKTQKQLNVFGWGATDNGFIISGSGSGDSDGRGNGEKKKLLEGLGLNGFTYNEELIKMYEKFKDGREGSSLGSSASTFFKLYEPDVTYYTDTLMNNALSFSDTALIVISRLGGESKDLPVKQYKSKGDDNSRTYLQLSTEEEMLIETVTGAGFKKVIVLLNTCNAMELGFLENAGIDAALSVGGAGQSGTVAIGKVLKGEVTPSGKTVDAYAYDLKSDPSYVNAGVQGLSDYTNSGKYIDYAEGIYTGYFYYETAAAENYIDYSSTVQYPFGYGLSYTDFKQEVIAVYPDAGEGLSKDGKIKVVVDVTNTGSAYAGQDVVQVYYTAPYKKGGIEKAHVKLCAFNKTILLEPGETQRIEVEFDVYQMASYDCYDKNNNGFSGYELDEGKYEIKVQKNSHEIVEDPQAVTAYTLLSPIRYETDPSSNNPVENLFTGAGAYAGVAIDGKNSDANIKYMTRADFANTFPKSKAAARAKTANIIALGDKWATDKNNTATMPTQGVRGDLRLTQDVNNEKVMNDKLVQLLGKDYYADEWEDLLNQLTVAELNELVEKAGYRTAKADSIGKLEAIDLDGPSGLNQVNMSSADSSWVCYPVETVLASTWNANLSYVYGLAVGLEAAATNVSGWYAPAVNLHRSPFDGRNFEYYSQDPYLSGVMGAETTRGATANGLYCYIKHFAVNETESNREGLYTWLDEQTLREIYLRPFEYCVKEGGANAMMSSFNRLGAVWTGGNHSLLTAVLRDEWGFRGSVVTDWTMGGNYMNVDQGIRAGNDCWLSGAGTVSGHSDKTSATAVSCARTAAKNMLFTYCNTYYTNKNHDSSNDRFVANVGVKTPIEKFPYWAFILAAIDVVAVAGLTVWGVFVFKKRKRKNSEKNSEQI